MNGKENKEEIPMVSECWRTVLGRLGSRRSFFVSPDKNARKPETGRGHEVAKRKTECEKCPYKVCWKPGTEKKYILKKHWREKRSTKRIFRFSVPKRSKHKKLLADWINGRKNLWNARCGWNICHQFDPQNPGNQCECQQERDQFLVKWGWKKITGSNQAHCKTGYAENPIDQRTGTGNGNVGRLSEEKWRNASKGAFW